GQRLWIDCRDRLRVKTLILKPQPVAVAQVLELCSNDGSESLSHHGSGEMVLGEAAGPQVDVIDAAISLLERLQRSWVARDLLEAGIRLKAERHARLVERAEAEIVAALDIDRCKVLPVRGVEQEVAQAVDDARVERLRRVGSEMAQESVGAAVGGEIRRRQKERILELQRRAVDRALLVEALCVVRHDGMAEAVGCAGEFL